MHELGVTFHIMDHLEKVAAENKVTHVRKVTLELGEVSTGVMHDSDRVLFTELLDMGCKKAASVR